MAIGKWGKYQARHTPTAYTNFRTENGGENLTVPASAVRWSYAEFSTNQGIRGVHASTQNTGFIGWVILSPTKAAYGLVDSATNVWVGKAGYGWQVCDMQPEYYSQGSFISYVTANTGTYPANGRHSDGYWYVYQGLVPPNPPTPLTVPETITGGKETTITWGKATSDGGAISGYELHRSLNNGTFARVYRGAALTYANTVPYGTNTVQYSVRSYDVDNQLSSFTTGVVKNVVNNNPPVITCTDTDKGELEDGFTVHYSVTDEDAADSITVTEAIDGVTLRSFEATRAVDYTADVTALTWLKLLNGEHTLTITAVDNRGGTAVKSIKFTKAVHVIEFTLSTPLACDAAATKAMTQMLAAVPAGALVQVFACNNGYDVEPAWVDVTLKVLNNEKIFFANTEKTADKWGYNVRVIIDRNNTTGDCFITSIGGNFE